MTLKKIFAPLAAVALVAVMAVSLVSQTNTASAVINGMSTNVAAGGSIALGGVATITIDADEGGGNVQLITTNGTFTNLGGAPVIVTGYGTGAVTILDATTLTVIAGTGAADTNGDAATTAADACTNCLVGVGFSNGVASVLATGAVDDDNDGVAGPAVANVIIGGDQVDVLGTGFIDTDEDADTTAEAFAGTANLDTIIVVYTASATVPGTVTLTSTQGGTSKNVTIVVRGNAAAITLSMLRALSTSATSCVGVPVTTIQATGIAVGQAAAIGCVTVKDAGGAAIPGTPVVCTSTLGTLNVAALNTNANGLVGDLALPGSFSLTADANSIPGTKATVTCSSGGITASKDVSFGGNNSTCTIVADPASPQVGTGSTVTATFKDSTGGPVPDAQAPAFTAVNSGQSPANAALAGAATTTTTGASRQLLISAIPGPIGITATLGSINCTTTVNFVGTAPPPTPGPTPSAGFVGTIAPAGVSIVSYTGSTTQLNTDGTAAKVVSVSATVGGKMITFVIGAPAFVNVEFNAAFPAGLTGTLVIVKTGT